MNKAKITKENIVKLLTQSDSLEFEETQNEGSFNFTDFFTNNREKIQNMTTASCLSFLKNRQSIMRVIKSADFTFGSVTIKKTRNNSERVGVNDMTFRRLDAMVRVHLVGMIKDNGSALTEAINSLPSHPLIASYGLATTDLKSCVLGVLLGGSLPLIASVLNFEIASLVLAIYQDAKHVELGIDMSKFSTKEAVGKVCTVLKSKGYSMNSVEIGKAKQYADILKACSPKAKGLAAMDHYKEGLTSVYSMFNATIDFGKNDSI
uniref:Nucleoprotein n=1 Tax=Impatiens necrotic spot virus TaxID=11612 RepID=C7F6W9_INSV|nr:nucleocapsid protein [Impatiens necrotic spot virus]